MKSFLLLERASISITESFLAKSKQSVECYNNITKQGGAIFKLRDFKDTLEIDYLDSKDILEKE
ncbi:hypothetical protein, partial [Helicobacter pylori]|uniref:hypothetical protein n=1 Tax=Helicobacter pylori TaxID=210 RepID=UPI0009D1DA1B